MELTEREKYAIVDIIDGTLDTMDVLDGPDFEMWISILNKLGPRGHRFAADWLDEASYVVAQEG